MIFWTKGEGPDSSDYPARDPLHLLLTGGTVRKEEQGRYHYTIHDRTMHPLETSQYKKRLDETGRCLLHTYADQKYGVGNTVITYYEDELSPSRWTGYLSILLIVAIIAAVLLPFVQRIGR